MAGYDPLADATALGRWLDVAPGTVRSWASRGKLGRRGRDQRGRTLYSLAEAQRLTRTPGHDGT